MQGLTSFTAGDGFDIRVRVTGSGPPLVLLHEWGSNHHVWEPVARRIGDRCTLYRWDARGHGGQGTGGPPLSVQQMARDFSDLLDAFHLRRPTIVAHSMGALTLWAHIAQQGCERLGRLCIIDQSPRLTTGGDWPLGIYGDWPQHRDDAFIAAMRQDFVQAVIGLIAGGLNRAARERLAAGHAGIDRLRDYFRSIDSAPLIEVWPTLSRTDFRPALSRITVPTLLVYGAESNYYPPATGPWVRDAIPGAQLRIYPGADHSPHVGQAERFTADLAGFLDTPA